MDSSLQTAYEVTEHDWEVYANTGFMPDKMERAVIQAITPLQDRAVLDGKHSAYPSPTSTTADPACREPAVQSAPVPEPRWLSNDRARVGQSPRDIWQAACNRAVRSVQAHHPPAPSLESQSPQRRSWQHVQSSSQSREPALLPLSQSSYAISRSVEMPTWCKAQRVSNPYQSAPRTQSMRTSNTAYLPSLSSIRPRLQDLRTTVSQGRCRAEAPLRPPREIASWRNQQPGAAWEARELPSPPGSHSESPISVRPAAAVATQPRSYPPVVRQQPVLPQEGAHLPAGDVRRPSIHNQRYTCVPQAEYWKNIGNSWQPQPVATAPYPVPPLEMPLDLYRVDAQTQWYMRLTESRRSILQTTK